MVLNFASTTLPPRHLQSTPSLSQSAFFCLSKHLLFVLTNEFIGRYHGCGKKTSFFFWFIKIHVKNIFCCDFIRVQVLLNFQRSFQTSVQWIYAFFLQWENVSFEKLLNTTKVKIQKIELANQQCEYNLHSSDCHFDLPMC